MKSHAFFIRFYQFLNPRTVVTFVALGCYTLAYSGEIHDAAGKGDLEKVKELLQNNTNLVASKDDQGETPLHWASSEGQKNIVELLLADKADVNARQNLGYTPLHWASVGGHTEIVALLLANKANANASAKGGVTPLHEAACEGHAAVVE